jgi:hypothetical protein
MQIGRFRLGDRPHAPNDRREPRRRKGANLPEFDRFRTPTRWASRPRAKLPQRCVGRVKGRI